MVRPDIHVDPAASRNDEASQNLPTTLERGLFDDPRLAEQCAGVLERQLVCGVRLLEDVD